jgi:putative peptidoglycan lipid II flippase
MAKSAIMISVVSIITLCFSFFKESIFAYYYGASSETDAYTIAIQLPTTLFSLVSTAISNVVLPYYSKKLNKNGQKVATDYASNLMTMVTILSIIIVICCELFSNAIISVCVPGLSTETAHLASILFRLVVPTVILTELMNINTSILNVHKSFVLSSLASIVLNITYVSIVVLLGNSRGIYAAVCGTVIGTLVQFAYSVLLRRRYLKYRLICNPRDTDMIASIKKSLPVFVGIGAAEINKIVDEIVSSFLEDGSISLLNYASKLSSAISTLFIQGITTVVYPEFAESAAEKSDARMADCLLFSMKMIMLLLLPIMVGGAILSQEIITIIYRRGAFDAYAVASTAPIFACYLVCLLFRAIRQITSRAFYAYGDTKIPMKNSFIGIVINIMLDVTVVKFLGAVGLALATTVATAIISLFLLKDIRKKNKYISYKSLIPISIRISVSCFIMGLVLSVVQMLAHRFLLYDLSSFSVTCLYTICAVLIGIITYLSMLLLLRTEEVVDITKKMIRRKK